MTIAQHNWTYPWSRWRDYFSQPLKVNRLPSVDISMHFNGCYFKHKIQAFLQGINATICVRAKCNMGKVLMSLRGTHDLTVSCQNAKALIDSPVLSCMFELISTLRPRYMEDRSHGVLMFYSWFCQLVTQHSTPPGKKEYIGKIYFKYSFYLSIIY